MSTRKVPASAAHAASQRESQQDRDEVVQHGSTATYRAPYHHYEENRVPGVYIVAFRSGHTVAKHFAFLDREFDITAYEGDVGYFADMDDQLLDAVRRDPGVEFVEDNVSGERW